LSGHHGLVRSVVFSHSGTFLFSGGTDKTIRQWDVQRATELRSIPGHPTAVRSLALSSDDRILYAQTKGTQRWNVQPPNQAEIIDVSADRGLLNTVAISPDGNLVANADINGRTRVHRIDTGILAFEIETESSNLEFTPDSRFLLASSHTEKEVAVYDMATGSLTHKFPVESYIYSTSVSPDSNSVAIGTSSNISIVELRSGKQLKTVQGKYLRYSPDGRLYAVWSEEGVAMFDADNGRKLYVTNESGIDSVSAGNGFLKFSTDSRLVALVTGNSQIYVFEAESGNHVQLLGGQLTTIHAVDFCGDGRTIASCGQDQQITLWDLITGEPKCVLKAHGADVNSLAFCPIRNTLISAGEDNRIRLAHAGPPQTSDSLSNASVTGELAANYRNAGEISSAGLVNARAYDVFGKPAPPRDGTVQTFLQFEGTSSRLRLPDLKIDPEKGITMEAWL
ncbi:MAG: PQQ-binding-like beta-propeller repeat protein, partial [Planctomycetaceae bacterium]|nr:PQQ-binding-like beta-propeller repeat protein [Planctomycetaceae bacterium]